MASKKFQDGIAPSATGIRYQVTENSDGTSSIDNVTEWEQQPTEIRAVDLIQGMVLECDHTKVNQNHNLTNPNSLLSSIRFYVDVGQAYSGGEFYLNGQPLTIVGDEPTFVEGDTVFASIRGDTINFKTGGGIRLRVISVASENNLPFNAKEGTIALVGATVTVDNGEIFYTTETPSIAQNRTWIPNESPDQLQITVDNKGQVLLPVGTPSWCDGTAYQKPKSYMMTGGDWVPFRQYLFANGVQSVAWEETQYANRGSGTSIATQDGDSLYLSATYTGGQWGLSVGLVTSELYDLTDSIKLRFVVSNATVTTTSMIVGVFSSQTIQNGNGVPLNNVSSLTVYNPGTYEIDVSALAGTYYVGFSLTSN